MLNDYQKESFFKCYFYFSLSLEYILFTKNGTLFFIKEVLRYIH